ncbi:MAG: hypothetical protein JO199_06090 [Candidatus Eremiobacteraeota bacterium]|nr:hypothetical protein [Candidatus Eremiobacteraeota bacterium]
MKRVPISIVLLGLTIAAAAASLPARADTVLYQFAALRGGADTCQWFDDNINDRTLAAMIRQTDALYNRTALDPGADVTNVHTATLQNGTVVAGFTEHGIGLCSGDDAINASAPPAQEPVQPSPQ